MSRKEALRRSMRRVRGAVADAERERFADLVEELLFGLPATRSAETIMLFDSIGDEVPTSGMADRVLREGKRLLLPYLTEEAGMEAAEIRSGEPLVSTDYGPREPGRRVAVDPEQVDLIVIPGLAFDRLGNRLGYGRGHYDRYLARIGESPLRVGIAFSIQIVDRVPTEPGDERVHIVVTDQEAFDVRPVQ